MLIAAVLLLGAAAFAFFTPTGWAWVGRLTGWPSNLGELIPFGRPVEVEKLVFPHDQDGDQVTDLDDIVAGARDYVKTRPRYSDGYYAGGYPPDGEGVCTDVIWKALKAAGYDLKAALDADIAAHPGDYPRVADRPEPNIDFRRVQNLAVFFRKYGQSLTEEVKPGDPANLREWQGGDIVIFGRKLDHIGIVSDRRRKDGVPLLIHNAGPWGTEDDSLTRWPTGIRYHIRFPRLPESTG
ncbi:MAG: DUF1287 domain-containing protein [Bacillota bacterium]